MKGILFAFLSIILCYPYSVAQTNQLQVSTIPISTLYKVLDADHKIVGLGESTHGTKEFTTIRAEIVKTLVTEYNYNVFILEAE